MFQKMISIIANALISNLLFNAKNSSRYIVSYFEMELITYNQRLMPNRSFILLLIWLFHT